MKHTETIHSCSYTEPCTILIYDKTECITNTTKNNASHLTTRWKWSAKI